MSENIQNLLRSVSALAFIIIAIGSYVIVAQTAATGDWKAEYKAEKNGEIYLSFERRSEKGRNNNGSNYILSDLQGLTNAQLSAPDTPVKFSLVREAGTIDCEGRFNNGKGAGTFVFTENRSFVTAMKTRGFDFDKNTSKGNREPEDRLFAAATLNITTALADDLLSANFGKLDVDDLFKAAIFKVDSKFMREMKDSGLQNLTFEDLVKARIFKIDVDFVKQVVAMGFDKEPFESLVKMRIFKITPEFITEVRGEGLTNLGIEDLVKMRIFKIDSEFIRQARADGVPLEVEKLVQKRIGVWDKED